jgi:hypothetical protein
LHLLHHTVVNEQHSDVGISLVQMG